MRILIAIERIIEFTKQHQNLLHSFFEEFLSCETTKKFIIPQIDTKKSTFTTALLSTIQNIFNKLDSEFYKNEIFWRKDGFISYLLSIVQIPQFFETIKEDGVGKLLLIALCFKLISLSSNLQQVWCQRVFE